MSNEIKQSLRCENKIETEKRMKKSKKESSKKYDEETKK